MRETKDKPPFSDSSGQVDDDAILRGGGGRRSSWVLGKDDGFTFRSL